jgi:hypothetical protein
MHSRQASEDDDSLLCHLESCAVIIWVGLHLDNILNCVCGDDDDVVDFDAIEHGPLLYLLVEVEVEVFILFGGLGEGPDDWYRG